ncbi:glycoside hydrolase family 3 N-terminal domain-containing protein [Cytophagaceae bacterium DM2B3-1]|uniref:Glycoside hydrolase family 3 N-terminal domain-containing protein n=1 Tax=Xanthocytophaga flava TaxID=3048013 RepID=A0ABT7CRT0_9BACT|nr:glycoside hydrolase family 3 N-terminal domain-containing protein [Xanthocytophaga flavus]MDJ1495354.1 glycoside hydrolase family 3 N-terminal domain-containing protein [Xanthocytophaga flavus]
MTSMSYAQQTPLFRDSKQTLAVRTQDLLKQLTLEEKISLLGYRSPEITRLNIPAYNWWNEALHGVARAGEATIFPQAIGMAASFNDQLLKDISSAISTEARAKYNLSLQQNRRIQYMGLTFWSPNINIFRDPRWGRGQETYGEDPFLTSQMGVAFIKGLQGDDPRYLKTSACAKHFAVHSGPEAGRHSFNAVVDEKDLRETYLYAFNKLVDAKVESIMCGYNRVNNEPCCTSNTLLNDILIKEWHFQGHKVTDCGALDDIWSRHKVMKGPVEVAAAAIKAGINLDCSNILQKDALQAIKEGLLTAADIDSALAPALRTQFKLGFFDDPSLVPYSNLGAESVRSPEHVALARKMAQQSMVLLKNSKGVLPLKQSQYNSIMILGPNAASLDALVANYHGVSKNTVTFVEGITDAAGPGVGVQYDQGCDYTDTTRFGGLWAAENSDLSIAVLGLTPVLEGEEGDAFLAANGGDRVNMSLPASHIAFLKALRKRHNKPIVAVITAGSAIDIAAIEPYADAIVLAWYPGEQGGNALADILFGKISPSGHLPVTFYKSLSDLTAYDSYVMKGKTYRYFSGQVQYPFGFGLSYTSFAYNWGKVPKAVYSAKDVLEFTVTVKNTGTIDADEVVQAYIQYPGIERMPLKELKGFQRVTVTKNGEQNVTFKIPVSELRKWDLQKGQWKVYSGNYKIVLGSHSQDDKLSVTIKIK